MRKKRKEKEKRKEKRKGKEKRKDKRKKKDNISLLHIFLFPSTLTIVRMLCLTAKSSADL
jgi:hypothetical protein